MQMSTLYTHLKLNIDISNSWKKVIFSLTQNPLLRLEMSLLAGSNIPTSIGTSRYNKAYF